MLEKFEVPQIVLGPLHQYCNCGGDLNPCFLFVLGRFCGLGHQFGSCWNYACLQLHKPFQICFVIHWSIRLGNPMSQESDPKAIPNDCPRRASTSPASSMKLPGEWLHSQICPSSQIGSCSMFKLGIFGFRMDTS